MNFSIPLEKGTEFVLYRTWMRVWIVRFLINQPVCTTSASVMLSRHTRMCPHLLLHSRFLATKIDRITRGRRLDSTP